MPPWINLVARPVPEPVERALAPKLVWEGAEPREMSDAGSNLGDDVQRGASHGRAVKARAAKGRFAAGTRTCACSTSAGRDSYAPVVEIVRAAAAASVELYYDIKLGARPTAAPGFRLPRRTGARIVRCRCPAEARGKPSYPRGIRFMTVKVTGTGKRHIPPRVPRGRLPLRGRREVRVAERILGEHVGGVEGEHTLFDQRRRGRLLQPREPVWQFDAFVTCKAAFYSFGETRMWRRCLALVAEGIDCDGRPSAVVPTDVPSSLYGQAMHLPVSIRNTTWRPGTGRYVVGDGGRAAAVSRVLREVHHGRGAFHAADVVVALGRLGADRQQPVFAADERVTV